MRKGAISERYEGGGSMLVNYQPGNATRYDVLVTDCRGLGPGAGRMMGCGESGGFVVTLLNGSGRSMILPGNIGPLHWSYVAEKLGMNAADAGPITELLGVLLDRPVWLHAPEAVADGDDD